MNLCELIVIFVFNLKKKEEKIEMPILSQMSVQLLWQMICCKGEGMMGYDHVC